MSETYSIACHDCRIMLWVAQAPNPSQPERGYLYAGKVHDLHRRFLFDHIGHRLEFNSCQHLDNDYWNIDYYDLGTEDAPVKHRLHLGEDIVEPIEGHETSETQTPPCPFKFQEPEQPQIGDKPCDLGLDISCEDLRDKNRDRFLRSKPKFIILKPPK